MRPARILRLATSTKKAYRGVHIFSSAGQLGETFSNEAAKYHIVGHEVRDELHGYVGTAYFR